MQPNHLIALNEQNFESTLEISKHTPLLVYFWANVIPESVGLKAELEQLANEYQGAFILATLDCEQQQMLAAQFGVQSLPTIALFNQGQPVDGLAGPQPISHIREMLARHLPSQDTLAFNAALSLIASGNFNEALSALKALEGEITTSGQYKLALAECYIESKQFEQAKALLDTVLMQDQDGQFKRLLAKIELQQQAANSDEIRDLQAAFAQNPADNSIGYQLALQLSQVDQHEQALTILLQILQQDVNFGDGEVKKTMMDILSSLGQGNEIAGQFRRKLYSLLY